MQVHFQPFALNLTFEANLDTLERLVVPQKCEKLQVSPQSQVYHFMSQSER